jgi:hypothetical protein
MPPLHRVPKICQTRIGGFKSATAHEVEQAEAEPRHDVASSACAEMPRITPSCALPRQRQRHCDPAVIESGDRPTGGPASQRQ